MINSGIVKELTGNTIFDRLDLDDTLRAKVSTLLYDSFRVAKLPENALHFVLTINGDIVAYCATREVEIAVDHEKLKCDHLGLVCVRQDLRGTGLGTKLLTQFIGCRSSSGLDGTILNCGISVQLFYRNIGFVKVAESACYSRGGTTIVDDDPVFYLPYCQNAKLIIPQSCIYFGLDL